MQTVMHLHPPLHQHTADPGGVLRPPPLPTPPPTPRRDTRHSQFKGMWRCYRYTICIFICNQAAPLFKCALLKWTKCAEDGSFLRNVKKKNPHLKFSLPLFFFFLIPSGSAPFCKSPPPSYKNYLRGSLLS